MTMATAASDTTTGLHNAVAQTATYGGAGAAVAVHQMSLPDWAALVSMTVAVLGFLLQLYLAFRKPRAARHGGDTNA